MTKETTKQRRERERQEQEALELKFQAEKPTRLLHAIARAESLGIKALVYYRYDDVLYYEFDFSEINLPNSLDVITDPYEELSSWMMDSIENQLHMCFAKRNRDEHLKNLKMEVLARLTNEEKEALGI